MAKKKFKEGDKVRCINADKPCIKGRAYRVIRVCSDGWIAVKDYLRNGKVSGEKSPLWFQKVSPNK